MEDGVISPEGKNILRTEPHLYCIIPLLYCRTEESEGGGGVGEGGAPRDVSADMDRYR
jgi:hypothetical protein